MARCSVESFSYAVVIAVADDSRLSLSERVRCTRLEQPGLRLSSISKAAISAYLSHLSTSDPLYRSLSIHLSIQCHTVEYQKRTSSCTLIDLCFDTETNK